MFSKRKRSRVTTTVAFPRCSTLRFYLRKGTRAQGSRYYANPARSGAPRPLCKLTSNLRRIQVPHEAVNLLSLGLGLSGNDSRVSARHCASLSRGSSDSVSKTKAAAQVGKGRRPPHTQTNEHGSRDHQGAACVFLMRLELWNYVDYTVYMPGSDLRTFGKCLVFLSIKFL